MRVRVRVRERVRDKDIESIHFIRKHSRGLNLIPGVHEGKKERGGFIPLENPDFRCWLWWCDAGVRAGCANPGSCASGCCSCPVWPGSVSLSPDPLGAK